LEQGGWAPSTLFPVSGLDAQPHAPERLPPRPQRPLPSRRLPDKRHRDAHRPADVQRGGRQHHPLGFPHTQIPPIGLQCQNPGRRGQRLAVDVPRVGTLLRFKQYADRRLRPEGRSGLSPEIGTALPAPVDPAGGQSVGPGVRQAGLALVGCGHRSIVGPLRRTATGHRRSMASSDINYWPKALELGAWLETHARVREITVDRAGRATGAIYYDAQGSLREQRAKAVVTACNGVGTARLLLNSTSSQFPKGLANGNGLVGKNLMHQPCGIVVGFFEEWLGVEGAVPRGSTLLSQEFYETDPNRDFVRGYDLQVLGANEAPPTTALGGFLWAPVPLGGRPPSGIPGTPLACRRHNRYDRRLTRRAQPGDPRSYADRQPRHTRAQDPIHRGRKHQADAGPRDRKGQRGVPGGGSQEDALVPPAAQCRLAPAGDRPHGGRPGRLCRRPLGPGHEVPNLFIIDCSTFVTGACVNPTTTIPALALRTADYIKGEGRGRFE